MIYLIHESYFTKEYFAEYFFFNVLQQLNNIFLIFIQLWHMLTNFIGEQQADGQSNEQGPIK